MSVKRRLWGIRAKIPQGVMLARKSGGDGDVELLTFAEVKGPDVLNITDGLLHPQVMSRICIGS